MLDPQHVCAHSQLAAQPAPAANYRFLKTVRWSTPAAPRAPSPLEAPPLAAPAALATTLRRAAAFAVHGERRARAPIKWMGACCPVRATCVPGLLLLFARSPRHPFPLPACFCSKAGFYTSRTRSSTCSPCPKGSQCPLLGTKTPAACKVGYFASREGSKTCTPCPVNTFISTTGATSCKPCASGTSTRGLTGQSRCQTLRPSLRRSLL